MAQVKQQSKDNSATKIQGILDQKEVAYTPVSMTPGQACSSCLWYRNHYCHIVSNYPESIEPNGWCNRHEVFTPTPVDMTMAPIPVVIVEPDLAFDDSQEMALPMPTDRKGLKAAVLDMVKGFIAKPQEKTVERAFTVFKGGNSGEWYWLARHTGKWVDREDEILADKAHEEYVARVQKGLVPMPELWTWHKKGTMHGVADFVWKSGGFVLALGHLVGTQEQKDRAAKWYNDHPDTKLSHMFKYPSGGKKKKVYYAYNTVEITTLPNGAEAFPYTTFEGLGNMPFTKQQEEQIRGIGGEEMWQRALAADTKALEETAKNDAAGIASKNHDNFEGSTIPDDEDNKALLTAQKDMNERLLKVEKLLTMPDTLGRIDDTLKSLVEKVGTMQETSSQALAKANDNEKKLLEYQAVEPPASKSKDTIINERERAFYETMSEEAKTQSEQSLIQRMSGESLAPAPSA